MVRECLSLSACAGNMRKRMLVRRLIVECQENRTTKPMCKSYEVVSAAVNDKLIKAKLTFFKSVAQHLQEIRTVYRSDAPVSCFLLDDLSEVIQSLD